MSSWPVELSELPTGWDDDGGVSVGDEFSFPPDFDYDDEIEATTRYLSAVYSAKAYVESARNSFHELRVIEAARVLVEALGSFDWDAAGSPPDIFVSQARALLKAIDEGRV